MVRWIGGGRVELACPPPLQRCKGMIELHIEGAGVLYAQGHGFPDIIALGSGHVYKFNKRVTSTPRPGKPSWKAALYVSASVRQFPHATPSNLTGKAKG